jgi:hypothetical protein
MTMKKKTLLAVWLVAGIAIVGAAVLNIAGAVPPWLSGAVIVIAFPVFMLFLCLWWMAPDRDGDIPFIGY